MRSRNFLIVAAISALAATPSFAQQKTQQPTKVASTASHDTAKTSTRKHRRSTAVQSKTAATPAVAATPAKPSTMSAKSEGAATAAQHKPAKHSTTRKPKKASTDTTKKSTPATKKP